MTRRDLTLTDKIALLEQIKNQPAKTSQRALAKILGVPKSTIGRVIQQQEKLQDEWKLHEGKQGTCHKRKRGGKNPDVEDALFEWYSQVSSQNVRVSGPILKSKSEELAKKLGHDNFKATDGWLSRWKTRFEVKIQKAHGEKDTVSAEYWKYIKLPILLQKFCADDIYNADETGLSFRASPDGSLNFQVENLSAVQKQDCITILCCSNMSGTDKRKLLVIGSISKPQCFKGICMDSLPVQYHSNKTAWMKSEIFTKWLMTWDAELQKQSRKILLILDCCTAHPRLSFLKNIKLEFLPPNPTFPVQPMEVGIIKHLKTLYRAELVNFILESIEDNLLTSNSTAEDVGMKIDLLQAIQFLSSSWRRVSPNIIQNCFAQCGFCHSDLELPENASLSDDGTLVMHVVNYNDFLNLDDNLACYKTNKDSDDAIVEQIAAKRQKLAAVELESNIEEDDNTVERRSVTIQEARKYISGLQLFFIQEGNESSPIPALDIVADFVHAQSIKRKQLGTLHHFIQCQELQYHL